MTPSCGEYLQRLEADLESLKKSTNEIVLYGTADLSELVFQTMKELQIAHRHAFYVDGSAVRQGKRLHGKMIFPPEKLFEEKERDVIICSYKENVFEEISRSHAGHERLHFYRADAARLWYQIGVRGRGVSLSQLGKVLYQLRYPMKTDVVFGSVDVVVTERCTLRCRDCIQLIPYFKSPVNYKKEGIAESVKAFSKLVDAVGNVRIIGGEPFLHPDIVQIVKACIWDNFLDIGITTNGTIVPKDEILDELAKMPVHISISDYGTNSVKIDEVIRKFQEFGIDYTVLDSSYVWHHVNFPEKQNRSDEENDRIYNTCKSKQNQTILNGKLYRCNYSGAIEPFGVLENTAFDLLAETDGIEKRKALYAFESRCSRVNACDYCRVWEEIPVGAGVQVNIRQG